MDYRGADWYVPDLKGPHVDREAWTVKFEPKLMTSLDGLTDNVAKIVGVSDDHEAVAKASTEAHDKFGDHVTAAASQPYYLDVTHPQANKGEVAKYLAGLYKLSTEEIATIGDMPNDVLMFAHSGLSIAMGNADAPGPAGRPSRNGHQRKRGLRASCAPLRLAHPGVTALEPGPQRARRLGSHGQVDDRRRYSVCAGRQGRVPATHRAGVTEGRPGKLQRQCVGIRLERTSSQSRMYSPKLVSHRAWPAERGAPPNPSGAGWASA